MQLASESSHSVKRDHKGNPWRNTGESERQGKDPQWSVHATLIPAGPQRQSVEEHRRIGMTGKGSTMERPCNVDYSREESMVELLVERGLSIGDVFLPVLPLSNLAKRVTLSNVPPFISNASLERLLGRYDLLKEQEQCESQSIDYDSDSVASDETDMSEMNSQGNSVDKMSSICSSFSEAPPTTITPSVKLLPLQFINKCWNISISLQVKTSIKASGRSEICRDRVY
ncbi:hypothetical protein QQF64_023811 [Cirrhinus molitorella]|uniref:Uncharacterized protein n=1 Tax=Cirrhinus molitorella TaxID=172907 RepID=A0ABR3NJG5_9TELE